MSADSLKQGKKQENNINYQLLQPKHPEFSNNFLVDLLIYHPYIPGVERIDGKRATPIIIWSRFIMAPKTKPRCTSLNHFRFNLSTTNWALPPHDVALNDALFGLQTSYDLAPQVNSEHQMSDGI